MIFDWLNHFWIGENETDITEIGDMLSSIQITPKKLKEVVRNVKGQLKKVSLDNIFEDIVMTCSNMLIADVDKLQSLILDADGLLYFKFFDTGRYHTETRISQTTTTIKIRATSRAFIVLHSVVLKSDPEGTNYGGTLDMDKFIITTAAPLPLANSEVLVSYYYKGWRGDVTIDDNSLVENKKTGLWNFNFSIEGK